MKKAGLLSLETIRFIRKAIDNNIEFEQILEDTRNIAQSINIALSPKSIEEIQSLAAPDLNDISLVPSSQGISVLNKIILDGRFIDSWHNNLDDVATELNIELTPDLRQELNSTSIEALYKNDLNQEAQASVATTAAGVVAAVVVGAAVVHRGTHEEVPVLDFSNVPKF